MAPSVSVLTWFDCACTKILSGAGGVLKEFLGGDVQLGPWNPKPISELVQLNFATL